MNELRPCAPLSLKHVLAQEVVKGLQAVSDSLVRYNAMRMLRGNESALFLSLCQAFIEVRQVFYDRATVLNLAIEYDVLQYTWNETEQLKSLKPIKSKLYPVNISL